MKEQGLTQAQVAATVGISQARVSQIERGEIHNLETMRTYAAALGARITVSIEYGDRTIGAAQQGNCHVTRLRRPRCSLIG
ncbi:helix-turn-helix transcriptional regulator [Streptomyces sp. NPDC001634]|uniref:helix-turn-helix transcriptional regulator n=1 Tax=Streptomyces sp. NPDC001634 TaxID=3154390 RepID=UPI003332431E